MNTKKCPSCGAELPQDASICPGCMADLSGRRDVRPPKRRARLWLPIAAVLVVAAVLLVIFLPGKSAPLVLDEGGPSLTYQNGDESYTLLAHFDYSTGGPMQEAEASRDISLGRDESTGTLTHITALSEDGASASEDLRSLVESVSLETATFDGEKDVLTVAAWGVYEDFPTATYTGELRLHGAESTAEVAWTLNMKNGDTLILRQQVNISELSKNVYTPDNASIDDIDGLRALIKEIETELSADMVVDIYLPPVRYEGGLEMANHAVNLYGGSDGENSTVFTGTITVAARSPSVVGIYGVRFEGSGGTGLLAANAVTLRDCIFTGWDTGIYMSDGAFVLPQDCAFENNGIGVHFNSASSNFSSPAFPGNTFTGNGTAVLLETVPIPETICFDGCVFSGNGTDIDNPSGHGIDTSAAQFE